MPMLFGVGRGPSLDKQLQCCVRGRVSTSGRLELAVEKSKNASQRVHIQSASARLFRCYPTVVVQVEMGGISNGGGPGIPEVTV